jgi:hypothetical protein
VSGIGTEHQIVREQSCRTQAGRSRRSSERRCLGEGDVSIVSPFNETKRFAELVELTASRASGHAFSSGTVDGASILLQGLVGETAGAVGGLAGLNLAAGNVVDSLNIGDGGRREGNEAKENGGDGELHLE